MRLFYETFEEIKRKIQMYNHSVICVGAGKIFGDICNDILPNIYAVADSNKYGEKICINNKEFKIISTQEIQQYSTRDGYVILISTIYYKEILRILKGELEEDFWCYIPYDLFDIRINGNIEDDKWEKKRIQDSNREMVFQLLDMYESDENTNKTAIAALNESERNRKFILPKICFLATTRCTLKCRGCIGMIDKMNKQKDYPLESVLSDFERVMSSVDGLIGAEISGGEPFLYSHFNELLETMIANEKVHSIIIPTNATILPDEERISLLKSKKVFLHISDYGNIVQIAKLINLLEKNGIAFRFMTNQHWIDPGNEKKKRKKSHEELCVDYQNCSNGVLCKTVFQGRLYHCARAARCYLVNNDIETALQDSIDIIEEKGRAQRIKDFFLAEYSYACDYCDLTNEDSQVIEAGKQINNTNTVKSKYTFCKRTD